MGLSGFGYRHPNVHYRRIAHPKGSDPPIPSSDWDTSTCAEISTTLAPEADFLKVFWPTLMAISIPAIAGSGHGNFPYNHLCCYFTGLLNLTDAACGQGHS